jgi:hypothetical protein
VLRSDPHLNSTQTALVAQRENLRPPLPARITILKEIIALSDKGLLGEIPNDLKVADSEDSLKEMVGARRLSILLKAQAEGGFVVDHLTSILPDELSKHVVQAEDVVKSLKALGALSEVEYEGALQTLNGNASGSGQLFSKKTKIFLLGDNLSKLAKAGVLKSACEEFEVFTEGNYLKTARLEIETNNRRTEIESWVATLIDHVREGLTSGTYQGIDISEGMAKVAGDEDEPEQSNWDFASSSHLLRYKCEKNDVLYFDDRTINAYGHRDNIAPIIGISEVLLALRLREEISEQQYFDKLIKLRASNYRYLPITGEEILYHLKRASTGDRGHVLESFELAVLRKYLGACLVDAAYLQRPPLPKDAPNQTGELKFLANTTRAVTEALVGVWADENIAVDIAQAQSEWILRNLYTGLFGVMHLLPNPETRGDGVQHIGLDIGSIFVYGQTIHGSNLEPRGYERRRQFFEWLEGRLLRPRSDADPEALTSAAEAISSTFSDTFARHEKSSDVEVVGRLVKYQFFVDLPESLREAMKLKPELMEWLGFELTDVIDIGPVQFDASAFWRAAADAVNGRPAFLPARKEKVADADAMFTFKAVPIAEGGIVIEISDPAGSIFYRYGDKIEGILKDENTEREAILRRYRSWFDLDAEAFETEVENIVAVDDPQTRLEKVNDLRKRSADYFYWSLREYLIAKNQIPESGVMPPDAESLMRQFRLSITSDEKSDLTTALSESAPRIVEDYGLPIALTRFAWLPIKMPQRLVELFRDLNAKEKEALLSQFKKGWQSPVGKLHFVDLVLRSSADKQAALDSAKSNLVDLFNDDDGVINFAAFKAVLEFVNTEIGFVKGAFEVPPAIRLLLVWAHACHLHNLFCSVGTKPEGLARLFQDMSWRSEADIILREPNYWNDCLHPRMLNRTVFLTHATALVLGANDQKAQATIGVKETLDGFLSGDEKNERFLQLFRDPELMTNGSGSFLGGDRAKALSTIFDALEVQPLASVSIKDALRQAIENLKANPADPSSWAVVRTAIWDLPLYSDLYESFSAVVKSLDFDAPLAADPATATYAIMVAASQLPYFPDDEIRMSLEPKWLALVKHYSAELAQEHYPEDRAAGVIAMLLEGALGMAVELNDPRATSRAWGGLLLRMLNVAPELASHLGHLILKRVFELPAAQLHGLFPVLLAVRALDQEPL